jgi:uncharacterized protein YdeI (YjbR/CyaY-like superfamily)
VNTVSGKDRELWNVPVSNRAAGETAAASTLGDLDRRSGSTANTLCATNADEWREWLAENHRSEKEVWLVIYHKNSGTPNLRYDEAIEHALCFGWIDSLARKRDAESWMLRFTPRNPRSRWSEVNRRRAAKMLELGLMTEHGRALFEAAQNQDQNRRARAEAKQ